MTHPTALDIVVLLVIFLFLALFAIAFQPRQLLAWIREEWRLLRLDTWDDGKYDAPRSPARQPTVERGDGTANDPKVKRLLDQQVAIAERLRDQGRSILAGKQYIPALTKPADGPPPKANKVVPIRRAIPTSPRKETL